MSPDFSATPVPTVDETADYRSIFLSGAPMLDLRAPAEFARGAFPNAENLPLMSDAERAQVGTCYKHQGQEAAIALGHELVGGELRESRLAEWLAFAQQHPEGYLYCFRGGLRSQIVQQWLAEAGTPYPRIIGGYKALRQYLLGVLEVAATTQDIIVLSGRTGSGKTLLLPELPRALDLEGLANHRGSAFGALLTPQPTQIDFENALAVALLRVRQAPGAVFLEDESRLIGRVALPEHFHQRMQAAPYVEIQLGLGARVEGVLNDYIVDLGRRFAEARGAQGPRAHRDRLQGDLARLQKRLGGERHRRLSKLMDAGFGAQQRGGDLQPHREWIAQLLRDYYDPMYDYQLTRRAAPCLFRGTPGEIAAWARAQ